MKSHKWALKEARRRDRDAGKRWGRLRSSLAYRRKLLRQCREGAAGDAA